MLRIRFHGRGGQGIKTASQILGTAGFFSGLHAQDFPLYGAERRGAPICAFTRLDENDVLERGAIQHPHLILIADETLIDDPIAAPLRGADSLTGIFINSPHTGKALADHYDLPAVPVTLDLTSRCIRYLKKGTILSSALAAAGARLSGIIEFSRLQEAIRQELEQQGLRGDLVQRNLDLADETFNAISPIIFKKREEAVPGPARMIGLVRQDPEHAAPLILNPGNMAFRKTGNWRMERPEIEYEKCNGCWICFVRCPDGAMGIRPDAKPEIDYDHCKGCLICAQECPTHAIHVSREVSSWS